MSFIAECGEFALDKWGEVRKIASIAYSFVCLALRRSSWNRTVKAQLGKQILFSGIEAVGLIVMIAILAGISVVVQTQLWLTRFGQTELLGGILVAVIIREIGPLLVNFVVIGRSGTALSTELANMRVRFETDVLDAQGVDPMIYLVLPRVLGIMISVLCLTVVFVVVSLASGYLFAFMLGVSIGDPSIFINTVFGSVYPADVFNLLAKTILPGLSTGVICCIEGLTIQGLVTEVPQATTRGVVKSIMALLLISAIVSVFTYV